MHARGPFLFSLFASALVCGCGARTPLSSGDGTSGTAGGGGSPGQMPRAARTVSVSWTHSCAITGDAKVACWGAKQFMDPVPTPTIVEGLGDVVEVAAGESLDCARRSNGTVWCWGGSFEEAPSKIDGAKFSSIVAGANNACGVAGAGAGVACLGMEFFVGSSCSNGIGGLTFEAEKVPSLSGIEGVAITERHACAFDGTGATYCWGCASEPPPEGSWSLGSMAKDTKKPIPVPDAPSTVLIAAETATTCAVQADGRTLCWGDRSQFGPGIVVQPVGPAVADFPPSPLDIDVGVTFSCAAYEGTVTCLGGIPTFADGCQDRLDDPQSFAVPGITELSVGYQHACARDRDGAVWCWGCNTAGEVGDGTKTPRATPTHVL